MVSKLTQWGFVFALLATAMVVQAQDDPAPKPAPPEGAPPGPTYRARQVIGSEVSLQGDAAAGEVEDIVFDANGQVEYLVVAVAKNKLVTVPWDAVKFNLEKRVAVVHVTEKQFQAVPTYTPQQYPTFFAPAYRTQIYGYYGLTPGQTRRAVRRGELP